ncbi:Lysyl oxidase -like protein 2 [Sarcoptes scabiei]|uniref:protein-lysine 6-oxidase n=1 Tax=Sarcoptes scabiei TaxID=52283 RepID=A0A834R5Z0_SARSC|nr:Lysyl oxidase -like protein 2 [Sarcoptes scabiei]
MIWCLRIFSPLLLINLLAKHHCVPSPLYDDERLIHLTDFDDWLDYSYQDESVETKIEEGAVRLVNGRTMFEGNVEIYHFGQWGGVCDDEWNIRDAHVVCRQLGFVLGGLRITTDGRYGQDQTMIWMDNVSCNGSEDSLSKCRFNGWNIHDCQASEAAGVICRINLNQQVQNDWKEQDENKSNKKPSNILLKNIFGPKFPIRLNRSPTIDIKVLELFLENEWHQVCADGWSINEAQVVCRELDLEFVDSIVSLDHASSSGMTLISSKIVAGIKCNGEEASLSECRKIFPNYCPDNHIVAMSCVPSLADLTPDASIVQQSAFIEERSIMFLQCALEENCLSDSAYKIDRNDPSWIFETRKLLRFTASIKNIGNADFLPNQSKNKWIWHSCHQHYHSMEVFAHFEIIDLSTNSSIVEGHKASFCLEDNECDQDDEVLDRSRYACADFGDQGISVGCVDIYKYDLDCQWIDITDLHAGSYILKITINPEQKIPEKTFRNNAVKCLFDYYGHRTSVSNCSISMP